MANGQMIITEVDEDNEPKSLPIIVSINLINTVLPISHAILPNSLFSWEEESKRVACRSNKTVAEKSNSVWRS